MTFSLKMLLNTMSKIESTEYGKLTKAEARKILDFALDLEKTGRLVSSLVCSSDGSQGGSQELTDMRLTNRGVECALRDLLDLLTEPTVVQAKPEPFAWFCGQNVRFEKPVEGFESYFNALYLEPLDRVAVAWRSKENYSPDVGSWFEYYDAFRETNDTTGLTPLYE